MNSVGAREREREVKHQVRSTKERGLISGKMQMQVGEPKHLAKELIKRKGPFLWVINLSGKTTRDRFSLTV